MARRQLMAEPAKLAVTLAAVAAAMALVLLLAGLRRGIGEQTTLYVDRQAPVLVGQKGVRNFIAQPSVLPDAVGARLAAVPGVASVTPVTEGYAMFRLHGQRVLSLLVGFDPGRDGGPWALADGRPPTGPGEVVLDRVLASSHDLRVGSTLRYRAATLRVVGLASGTAGWMMPLGFATRQSAEICLPLMPHHSRLRGREPGGARRQRHITRGWVGTKIRPERIREPPVQLGVFHAARRNVGQHEPPARAQHPAHLAQERPHVRDVVVGKLVRHEVESLAREREPRPVAAHPPDGRGFAPRHPQHPVERVEPHQPRARRQTR
jgi:hypothetical protein